MTFVQDVETFIDQYFNEQMTQLNVPGVSFVLVNAEEILIARGYGWANLEQKIAVIPDQTLFRVGSISKLFTTTAIMQLVERGQLDLFTDINQYLKDFQIPVKFSHPIVTAHLLTHTAGFDEHSIALETFKAEEIVPLGDYLARAMPPRILPPGETINYSNHGMGLAGHLVEAITDMPFEQYVQTYIFQPLEMHRSSFQPTKELSLSMAIGYEGTANRYQAVSYSYIKIPPGGSLVATATDIGHFMMAHLQQGTYHNLRILSRSTAQLMHQQQFTNHPQLPGFAYGFYENLSNNQRAIMHGGTVRGFASLLFLLPDQNIGFFLTANSLSIELVSNFQQQFLDQFFPCTHPAHISPNHQSTNSKYTGYYGNFGYSRHTLQKISSLFSQIHVTANQEGLVIPSFSDTEEVLPWLEVEPHLFQQSGRDEYLAFRVNPQGHVTQLLRDIRVLEKLSWYRSKPFHVSILLFFILFFIGTWSFLSLSNFSIVPEISRQLIISSTGLSTTFIIGFIIAASNPNELTYGVSKFMVGLLCLPLVAMLLTISLMIITAISWTNTDLILWHYLYILLIVTINFAFSCWLKYWNLLGFKF